MRSNLRAYAPGTWLFVKYNVRERVAHERIILAHIIDQRYQILTPDGDIYSENFSLDESEDYAWVKVKPRAGLPYGVVAGTTVHRFDPIPTEDELGALYQEAYVDCSNIRYAEGLDACRRTPHLLQSAEGRHLDDLNPTINPPAGPILDAVEVDAADAGVRVPDDGGGLDALREAVNSRSSLTGVAIRDSGKAGGPSSSSAEVGAVGGKFGPDGKAIPVVVGLAPRTDQRVLSNSYDNLGKRYRSFREGVEMLENIPFTDWPVTGPMTVIWVLMFMLHKANSPTGWHVMWKSLTKFAEFDPWCVHHESLCRILECAVCYDQLNLASLASFELICRSLQSIEEMTKERVLEGSQVPQDHYLMSGVQSRTVLCICPELTKYSAAEASIETSILKERRKAREEIAALKPNGKAKAGGKGGAPG